MIAWVQCNDINYFWLRVYSLKTFSKVIRNNKSLKKILWKVVKIYCVFWYFITEQWNPWSLQQLLWVETFQHDYQTLITLLLSGSETFSNKMSPKPPRITRFIVVVIIYLVSLYLRIFCKPISWIYWIESFFNA